MRQHVMVASLLNTVNEATDGMVVSFEHCKWDNRWYGGVPYEHFEWGNMLW